MSIKNKPTVNKIDNKQEDSEKPVRSDSTISHSSWIYKLTSAPIPTKLENTTKEEEEKEIVEEPSQIKIELKLSPTTEQEKDEPQDKPSKTEHHNSGIWSWLGYSGPQQPQQPSSDLEKESIISTESSIAPEEKEEEKEEEKVVGDIKKEEENAPESNHHRSTAKPSYWKSLFSSSTSTVDDSNRDSVIISDDNSEQQTQQQTPIEETHDSVDNNNSSVPIIEETIAEKLPIPPSRHNAVLPTFKSQFHVPSVLDNNEENSNIFCKAINAINSIFTQKPVKSITSDWQDIHYLSTMIDTMKSDPEHVAGKNIVIIGVHGWFPMKLVRSVVGEPTGTSIKFCEQMTLAVKKYFKESHDLDIPDEAITNIPLQWEGKVLERVEKLHEYLMSDWKETIEKADVVLWVTHSQGTPVSAILLKRLIEENIIQIDRQPICMLAMAGISHGPFPSLKGSLLVKYFEADAARELFEFMDSNSDISVQYREAIAFILQNKVKTVLMGSMQDQVVPLYSAIMSGISHPNILRAIYIDGHIYTKDDFLIRLITFALRLLNVGLSDHGFLIHISEVLAGNIYSWEGGHSTVYEELDVFMLPLQYMFETSPFGNLQVSTPTSLLTQQVKESSDRAKQHVLDKVKARLDPFQAKMRLNPFHLPWAMRGIWDDPRILNDDHLSHELDKLQDLFDKWNPTSARLKEIKFRLEPLKARL